MKKKLYLVIGNGKSGKSSLVRSLTGMWRYGLISIVRELPSDIINIQVWIRSLQEYGYTPERVLEEVLKYDEKYLLLTVRLQALAPCPDVLGYLQAFIPHYEIEGIIVISETPISNETMNEIEKYCPKKTYKFEGSLSTPVNRVSTEVKKFWHWV